MSSEDKTRIPAVGEVQTGTELNGIYRIDEKIAIGGMGEVYRGHNIQTGDPVAIKIVLPEFARDETILALFRKEASVLNHLSHQAIVRYHVFTIDHGLGRPYLAMEFVDGESLADRAARLPLTVEETIVLTAHLASGLQAAHDAGVIHRDLSPDNIIIKNGEVNRTKIIDFGIAKAAQIGGGTLIGGAFAGKYNFVSPEQLGLFGGEVTPKSDIYSLGLCVVAALKGEPLDMGGTQVEVIEKRRHVPNLTDIDPRLQALVSTMLQPDPDDRPGSMSEIAGWLATLKEPAPDAARAPPAVPPFAQPALASGTPPPEPAPLRAGPAVGQPAVARPSAAAQRGAQAGTKPEQKKSSGLIAVVAALLLVAGGGATYYFLAGGPDTDEVAQTTGTPGLVPTVDTERREDATPPSDGQGEQTGPGDAVPPTDGGQDIGQQAGLDPTGRPDEPTTDSTGPVIQDEDRSKREEPVTKAASLVDAVEKFDGGKCFYASASDVGENELTVEGFGVARQPFEQLDDSVQQSYGFEPTIYLRQIVDSQCAVVDFLAGLRPYEEAKPILTLSNDWIKSGDSLQGNVTNLGDKRISIFLVDNEGVVYNLGPHLQRKDDRAEFNIKLVELAPRDPLPQLILTLASSSDIDLLQITDPVLAASYFPAVLKAIRDGDAKVGTAMKFFKLGG